MNLWRNQGHTSQGVSPVCWGSAGRRAQWPEPAPVPATSPSSPAGTTRRLRNNPNKTPHGAVPESPHISRHRAVVPPGTAGEPPPLMAKFAGGSAAGTTTPGAALGAGGSAAGELCSISCGKKHTTTLILHTRHPNFKY